MQPRSGGSSVRADRPRSFEPWREFFPKLICFVDGASKFVYRSSDFRRDLLRLAKWDPGFRAGRHHERMKSLHRLDVTIRQSPISIVYVRPITEHELVQIGDQLAETRLVNALAA